MDPIKKNILIFILKLVIYACTLALSFLGACTLTSCAVRRGIFDAKATQNGVIIINDTIRLSLFPAPTTNDWRGKGVWGLGALCPQNHGIMLSDNTCAYEYR